MLLGHLGFSWWFSLLRYFNGVLDTQGSSGVGAPVAQRVKRWPTDLAVVSSSSARGEIFSTVDGVPLHTAFHYQGSWVRYPVWQHTFVSPSAFSRRAVVSYWRKYVHEVLVNRLGGLSLPRKSVVRLTDRPDMTLDVYRGRKTTMQQLSLSASHRPNMTEILLKRT